MTKKATTKNINKRGKISSQGYAKKVESLKRARLAKKVNGLPKRRLPRPINPLKPSTEGKGVITPKRATKAQILKDYEPYRKTHSLEEYKLLRKREQARLRKCKQRKHLHKAKFQPQLDYYQSVLNRKFDVNRLKGRSAFGTSFLIPVAPYKKELDNIKVLANPAPRKLRSIEQRPLARLNTWERHKRRCQIRNNPKKPNARKKIPRSRATIRQARRNYVEHRLDHKFSNYEYRLIFLAQNLKKNPTFWSLYQDARLKYPDNDAIRNASRFDRHKGDLAIWRRNVRKKTGGIIGRQRMYRMRKKRLRYY